MIPQSWSTSELLAWAHWGRLEERFRDLLRPHEMVWRDERESFVEAFGKLRRLVPPARRHLLPQAVIAATLSNPAAAPPWVTEWLPTAIDLAELGIPLPWEKLFTMRWGLFPVALANAARGIIGYVLAGVETEEPCRPVPAVPRWWDTVADREARASLAIVSRLLTGQRAASFFFWPLLPRLDRTLIYGPSLGLPCFLAVRGLWSGVMPQGLLASGRLDEEGRLGAVEGLAPKIAAAVAEGLTGLLYPQAASPEAPGEISGGIARLEAATLPEAVFLWETYRPGRGRDLVNDLHLLNHPERLAANALLLSDVTLQWPGFGAAYARQMALVAREKVLMGQFLDNLERAADQPDGSIERLRQLLAPFSEEQTELLARENPLAAFRIAQLQLTTASRQGRAETAARWASVSTRLLEPVTALGQGLELEADHLNRKFVHEHHGCYHFQPELPADVLEMVGALRDLLRVKQRYRAGALSPTLGKLYGTIAQNYGFCGPAHLEEVERYTDLAREAFGSGRVETHRDDWRRQCCYRFYARLEAGRREQAKEALAEYLGQPLEQCSEACFSRLNRYHHAALARFVADSGESPEGYRQWCRRKAFEQLAGHPWQLWLNNVGRFTEDQQFRKMIWTQAVELALSLGISATPMALLPLANLWQNRLEEDRQLEAKTRRVLAELQHPLLRREHFRELLACNSWQEVLAAVQSLKDRIFPFSYR